MIVENNLMFSIFTKICFFLHYVMWNTIGIGSYFAKSVPICFSYYLSLDDKFEILEDWSVRRKAEFLDELELVEFIRNLKISKMPSRSSLDTCINLRSVLKFTGKSLVNSATQTIRALLLATSFLSWLDFLSIQE